IDDVVVENMQEQYKQYVDERLARQLDGERQTNEVAVIAVANGEGMQRLFEQDLQAAYVISGGQTMNPSTQDFLAAIEAVPNSKIVLLPNDKNIIMAANQAASLALDKDVRVVNSVNLPQGISAILTYANVAQSNNLDEIADEMQVALKHVSSGEITTAVRDYENVRVGQYIGLLNGDLVFAANSLLDATRELLAKALREDSELVTLYYGD